MAGKLARWSRYDASTTSGARSAEQVVAVGGDGLVRDGLEDNEVGVDGPRYTRDV